MNILFLTHRLPYAPNRGDRFRAFHLMEAMSKFAGVTLFSLVHDDHEASQIGAVPFARAVYTARVSRSSNLVSGILRLPTVRPLTHTLLHAPDARRVLAAAVEEHRPDVVVAFCSGIANLVAAPPLNSFPLVLDMVDVDSAKWKSMSEQEPWPWSWVYKREARLLAQFERRVSLLAKKTLVVNDRERTVLSELAPEAAIEVVPNGIDIDSIRPGSAAPSSLTVVFCGVMNYRPNEEGVLWFAESIWPKVLEKCPEARFVVVGSEPTKRVQALAMSGRSITVTGSVPSVLPYLHEASVAIAPMRIARGVQNKVIEAIAAGIPVVTTSAVAAGAPKEVIPGIRVEDEPDAFAGAVVDLLKSPRERRLAMVAGCDLEALRWSRQTAPLENILRRAIGRAS